MARFIHITDTHDDTASKLLAVGNFANGQSIDAILHTGDFVEAGNVADEALANLQKLPELDKDLVSRLQSKKTTEQDNEKLQERIQLEMTYLMSPFANRYRAVDQVIQQIKQNNPGLEFIASLGNHDSKIAYKIMKSAKFAYDDNPTLDSIVIKGIRIKGMLNSCEIPNSYLHEQLQQMLMPYLTNYALGHDAGDNKELQELHAKELERLRKGDKPDLILVHKELNDPANGEKRIGTAAKTYLKENKYIPVLCGHYHEKSSIENYRDHPFIRSDPNTFYVIDFDEKTRRINWVDEYRLIKVSKHEPSCDRAEQDKAEIPAVEQEQKGEKELVAV